MTISRRALLVAVPFVGVAARVAQAAARPTITVYKGAT